MPGKSQSHSDTVLQMISTSHHIALYISAPPADDSNGGTELPGNGYGRKPFVPGAISTDADGHTRVFSNSTTILFGPATADWPMVSHFGVVDGAGNVKYTGQLPTPKTVQNGDYAQFDPGSLIVAED